MGPMERFRCSCAIRTDCPHKSASQLRRCGVFAWDETPIREFCRLEKESGEDRSSTMASSALTKNTIFGLLARGSQKTFNRPFQAKDARRRATTTIVG